MRIAVVGTGGVGGYFGGRLAMAGHEVHFIARGDHLRAIRRDGLRVESVLGDFVVDPARASDAPGDIGPADLVIMAVKAWQLADAAATLAPLLHRDTVVLPLLNGVEAADVLADALGRECVVNGLCRIIAAITGPGRIRHSAMEPSVILGETDNHRSERVLRVHDALVHAGIRATVAEDIQAALWAKFMLISTWSGIGAVTRSPVGVWRALPGTRSMAEACLREIHDVAHARGVNLSAKTIEETIAFIDRVPAEGTASMQRDIMAGRPSELDAQNGAVVRLGAGAGVPTPTHAFLYHSLLPLENAARG